LRSEVRFLTNALVYVVDKEKKESRAELRDMSEHGLSIKTDGYLDIEPNSSYIIAVIPEKESNLKKFQMEIESRWVKINKIKMESGFSVLVPFNEKEFSDYLDYLALKGQTETSEKNREITDTPSIETEKIELP